MKVTVKIRLEDNQIKADSPETGFHESFTNIILIDQNRHMIMALGVTLEDAQKINPEAYLSQKDVLITAPIFNIHDFQPTIAYATVRYLVAAARFSKRNRPLWSSSRHGKMILELWLNDYAQIPRSVREAFEYELLTNLVGFRKEVEQLFINGQAVTELNQELVKQSRRFRLEQWVANLLLDTLLLLSMMLLIGLFAMILYAITPPVFWLAADNTAMPNHVTGMILLLLFLLLMLTVYLSDIIATAGGLALLQYVLSKDTFVAIAKHRQSRSKGAKWVADYFIRKVLAGSC